MRADSYKETVVLPVFTPSTLMPWKSVKGAAANAKPVPIRAMKAEGLEPLGPALMPSLQLRNKDTINENTPANV